MKCPHCNEELSVPQRCLINAETYHNSVLAITNCCGKGVNIRPITKFDITAYTGTKTEDDWGEKFKK